MVFHAVVLLCLLVQLSALNMLWFANRAGLFLFMWPLCGVLSRVNFKYFTLLWGVSGSMQQACLFCTGQTISRMDCMFCLDLIIADILVFVRQGGFSSLSFPDITSMVGICPNGFFLCCSPFVYLSREFHLLKHGASLLVCFHIKVPSIYIGFLCSSVGNWMKNNLADLFIGNVLGEVRSR